MRVLRSKIVLFFLLFILISGILFIYHKEILKVIYPFHYQEVILEEARDNDLDPYLIAAIIYVESGFDSQATSHKNAKGLMQIMPRTGSWIAEELDYDDFERENLYNPYLNIKFGTWYLEQMGKAFDYNLIVMLAAYNGGQGNISSWIREGRWNGSETSINDIPFPETRQYVKKVMRTYRRYKYIYTN